MKDSENNDIKDSESDKIVLLAIEITTQLKYGSTQSRQYLEQAKMKLIKKNRINHHE